MAVSNTKLALLFFLALVSFETNAEEEKKPVIISTYVEAYYLYNFNKPIGNTQPTFIYNFNRNNEVNVNLAFVKAAYKNDKVRANLAFMAGTYTQANLAAEPEALRHIFEANIGIKVSAKSNLWVDAGIFPSHVGFETAIGKENYNLTRSLLAENSPYYEAGVKLGYTSENEKWFLSALLLNGWQRIKRPDGNTTAAFGTQITYKPSTSVTLNSSSFIGNDKPDSARQMRYFHNFYGIFKFSRKMSLTTGFDIGVELKLKGSSRMNIWYSPIVIAKYAATDKFSVSSRVEYYSDKNGVIISKSLGKGFHTFGLSANADYVLQKEMLWRLEARLLKSRDSVFPGRYTTRSNAFWLVSSISIAF